MVDASTTSTATEDPTLKRETSLAAIDKTRADTRKALADAQASEATAQLSVLKAAIGEATPSGFTGVTTANDGAGLAEQNALGINGLRSIARKIIEATLADPAQPVVSTSPSSTSTGGGKTAAPTPAPSPTPTSALVSPGTNVFISAGDTVPSSTAARSFTFQKDLIETALNRALALSQSIPVGGAGAGGKAIVAAPFAAAGLLLSGVMSVLSYAKSDAALGGRELKPSERTLLSLIAGAFAERKCKVRIGGNNPPVNDTIITALIQEITTLAETAGRARFEATKHAATVERLSPAPPTLVAGAAPQPPVDPDPNGEKPGHERALQGLNDAIGMFDDFLKAMLADQAGSPAILRVGEARDLEAFLADAKILQIGLEAGFGSYLSKKGFASGVTGKIDFSVSALVAASWRLLDPKTYEILGAGEAADLSAYTTIESVKLE